MSEQRIPAALSRLASFSLATLACALCVCTGLGQTAGHERDSDARAWMRKVRIAAYPLSTDNAKTIVDQAAKDGVYGIEIDNDIPGRYESLLEPTAKLEAIRAVSSAAHAANNKTFVYIAGLECITADGSAVHTLAKDHPEWLQRKITGEPAIFDSKSAFWIAKGEEDVWVSPYAADWRRLAGRVLTTAPWQRSSRRQDWMRGRILSSVTSTTRDSKSGLIFAFAQSQTFWRRFEVRRRR